MPSSFSGTLSETNLAQVLSVLNMYSKTGELRLERSGQPIGSIYFVDGKVAHAETDSALGHEALRQIVKSVDASYRFNPQGPPPESSFEESETPKILGWVQRQLEGPMQLLPMETILARNSSPSARGAPPEDDDLVLLAHLDGMRSLNEIAAKTKRAPRAVQEAMTKLFEAGFVHPMDRKAPQAASTPPKEYRRFPKRPGN